MLPAVEPSPVDPITVLVEVVADEEVELLGAAPVDALSVKRFVEPRVAPRLLAGAAAVVAPEVSEEEEVLVAVLVETMVVVEAAIEDPRLAAFEAFELEFREDIRFPLPLPRSPCNRGATSAEKRSA
jgi:hypothetical protein